VLKFHFAARSDVGVHRELNEDSGLASERLLAVADGLGGHAAGELASSTAISVLNATQLSGATADQISKRLTAATSDLSGKLIEQSGYHRERSGLGTTLSLVYLIENAEVAIFHIGDSRVYRQRDGVIERLTKDHTYVQKLIDAGELDENAARVHPQRSLLTQAIDCVTPAIGDFRATATQLGDKYLVCTDGLTGVMTDAEIQSALATLEPAAAVTKLVDLALDRDAPDNVTVIVAEVIESQDKNASDPIVVGAAAMKGNRASLASLRFPQDQMPSLETSRHEQIGVATNQQHDEQAAAASRNRFRIIVLTALVTLGFAVLGTYAALLGTQLFVGVQDGQVALFRGIPQSILFVKLNRPLSVSDLSISSFPTFEQQQISGGISVVDEKSGEELIEQLRERSNQQSLG